MITNPAELLSRQEELHEDLKPYLFEDTGELGFAVLQHPLVYQVPYFEGMNALSNAQYLFKKARAEECLADERWHDYIWLHERPWRFQALNDCLNCGLDHSAEVWPLIGRVWCDSENINQNLAGWKHIWSRAFPDRERVMSSGDRKAFQRLPEQIAVYRGIGHEDAAQGMSWTIDRAKAVWFANRAMHRKGHAPHLVTGTVLKQHVYGYFSHKSESEIVADPKFVTISQITPLSRSR